MPGDRLVLILTYGGEFLWLMWSVTLHPDAQIQYFTFLDSENHYDVSVMVQWLLHWHRLVKFQGRKCFLLPGNLSSKALLQTKLLFKLCYYSNMVSMFVRRSAGN